MIPGSDRFTQAKEFRVSDWPSSAIPAGRRTINIGFTVESIGNVVSGAWSNVRFYNDIASYFGMDRAAFYNRVVMFEFVPCAIGGEADKYRWATPAQVEVGRERILLIANTHRVDKLIFFSGKAWKSMPPTIERAQGRTNLLGDTKFEYGIYRYGDQSITAVGLRHPQYAPRAKMVSAVEQALAPPV